MMKYITKLKKTLICDVELCYIEKTFLKPQLNSQSKRKNIRVD